MDEDDDYVAGEEEESEDDEADDPKVKNYAISWRQEMLDLLFIMKLI